MRVKRLHQLQDYQVTTAQQTGGVLLTNAAFPGGDPECIRINLNSPRSGCRRAGAASFTFPRQQPPFDILSPSLLISLDQLRQWQENFAVVHDAVGDRLLGNIPTDDPAHDSILSNLQARSYEISHIDNLFEHLPVETELYSLYSAHNRSLSLFDADGPTSDGRGVLDHLRTAVSVYSQVPELRSYGDKKNARSGDLGPRGEQFREWLGKAGSLAIGSGEALDYVDYALKPLHLSGPGFHWKRCRGDLRLVAVDLLCRYKGQPVWCEIKADGDTWTSSAVIQILFYGAMLANGHQHCRLRRYFSSRFNDARPWLGVLVEDRKDKGFRADFKQSLAFLNHPCAKEVLDPFFDGMIAAMLERKDESWAVTTSSVIRWR